MKSCVQLPYQTRVDRGLVEGTFSFVKFGEVRADNDSAFHIVWEYGSDNLGGSDIVFPADGTAPINRVSSSVDTDTGDIYVLGNDINGAWTEQTFALTGQTPKALPTALWRHLTSYNADSATSPVIGGGFDGDIYFYNDAAPVTNGVPDNATDVLGFFSGANNRTLQAYFNCPSGYNAYIKSATISLDTRIAASILYKIYRRDYGGVPQIIRSGSLSSNGTSVFSRVLKIGRRLNPRADLIPLIQVDTNDTSVSVEFALNITEIGKEKYV